MSNFNKDLLLKGLTKLAAEATAGSPQERQKALLAKSHAGTISAEERDELTKSISGDTLGREATSALHSDTIRKSIEIDGYLDEMHKGVTYGLQTLADRLSKSEATSQNYRVAEGEALSSIGNALIAMNEKNEALEGLVKSLQVQLEQLGAAPARAPKSVATQAEGEALAKSATATPAAGEPLNVAPMPLNKGSHVPQKEGLGRQALLKSLMSMATNVDRYPNGVILGGGSIDDAITTLESTGKISETMKFEAEKYAAKS